MDPQWARESIMALCFARSGVSIDGGAGWIAGSHQISNLTEPPVTNNARKLAKGSVRQFTATTTAPCYNEAGGPP